MPKKIEYQKGQRLGECIYLHDVDSIGDRKALFLCRCGKKFKADISKIKKLHTKSCSCLKGIHGLKLHPLYSKWRSLKARCNNPNVKNYHNYGGRGIRVCDEWNNNFIAFYNYMMSLPNALKLGLTIDRRNNDGNYEPGNMRWADAHTQVVNRRIQRCNTSGYIGVSFKKKISKWGAYITVNLNTIILGCYIDIRDAVNARNQYIIDNNLTEYKIQ